MFAGLFCGPFLCLNLECASLPHILLQDSSIVSSVVQKLLLNFVKRPRIPLNSSHPAFSDDGGPGVLQRVGSVAGNVDTLSHHFPSNNWSMPIFFIPNLTQVWQS